jgi:beta-glucosidase
MAPRLDVPALLTALTLEEKASLLSGHGFWHTAAVERLDIPAIMVSDGPHGLRKQEPGNEDHVGLGGSTPATCFPTAAGLASSWNPDLAALVGDTIGLEARAQQLAVVLGPGINIKRSPLCGRNFEYLSEDPHLAGRLAAAMVDGIQAHGVGTSLKHYAVNNQETDRLRIDAIVDPRTLREIYLAAFETVVRESRPWTVMCSYNRINGEWASQDPWLLTEVLRDQWGFDGLVVSDWGAVEDCRLAAAAGLDLEMPGTGGLSAAKIVAAVEDGSLALDAVDRAARLVLELVAKALPALETEGDTFDVDAHHEIARRVGHESAVLLTNDGTLPLTPAAGDRILVVGEFARSPRYQGAGSSKVNPTKLSNALDALRSLVPEGVTVDFAAGFGVDDPTANDDTLADAAVAAADGADVVVLFLGLPASHESEGFDRTHLRLPEEQLVLLHRLTEGNSPVVVVLANGGVVETAAWSDRADAVLEGWLGGQAGGDAIADLLLGRANPSGKLAETVPMRLEDNPSFLNFPGEGRTVRYGEGLFVGYRHYDAVGRDVAFPFGFGLSYTTFDLDDFSVRTLDGDGTDPNRAEVTVRVTNTGGRAGAEVVQLYVGRPDAADRPIRELRGFRKVELEPGEDQRITFSLSERDLSGWDEEFGGWRYHPGPWEFAVGTSSRDLPHRSTVQLVGTAPSVPLDAHSTIGEWFEHPVGHEVLLEALRTSAAGDLTFLLSDPEGFRMLSSFPLNRMAAMTGGLVGSVEDFLSRLPASDRA